jgi:hypothetical protein
MLESDMMRLSTDYLRHQNQFHQIRQEVPFLSRCIDLVLLDKLDNLISIEFKISKWRQAIKQAKNHKLGADKAYICIPERKLTDSLIQAVREAGIGLLFFCQDAEKVIYEVIPAPNDYENVSVFRDMLISNISKIND